MFMIKLRSTHFAFVGLLTFAGLTQEIQATPMFTAQTGMDCTGCHTQIMPRLNKFGRKFAASGMTMSQQMAEMELNPSMLVKSKYARTWDKPDGKGNIKEDDTNDGELSIVRMASFSYGGRFTENVGGLVTLGWRKEEGDSISGKVTYADSIDDGYWGTTFFSNSSQGPFSGMEFYNTALYKPLRVFDMRIYSNANQATRIGTQSATGLQAYVDKDNFITTSDHIFITAGFYVPAQDNSIMKMSDNLLPFARIAYEYPIGDYNMIIGAYIISGGKTVSSTEPLSIKRDTYGMDLQFEGHIADREATLAFVKVFKNEVEYTGIGAQSDLDDTEDVHNKAFSVEGTLSVTPDLIAKVAYLTYDDLFDYRYNGASSAAEKIDAKDLDSAFNIGLDYGFVLTDTTIKLALEYAWMNPKLDRVKDYESFMATFTFPF